MGGERGEEENKAVRQGGEGRGGRGGRGEGGSAACCAALMVWARPGCSSTWLPDSKGKRLAKGTLGMYVDVACC